MKDIILVTDIGVDCDDAVALGIILNYHNQGKCNLIAIATSTSREGATATIKTICDYYGVSVEIGRMFAPILECDKKNVYALDIMNKFVNKDVEEDNVTIIRKKLAQAKNKVTLVEIGPLTSLAQVLKSEADIYSSLDGIELVKSKVDKVYVMGGSFDQNFIDKERKAKPEWNILQDIKSAKYAIENCPSEMFFLPFEAGVNVASKKGTTENPVWECMKIFAQKDNKDINGYSRSSWDPVTCMLAVEGCKGFYDISPLGKVSVNDDGLTVFSEGNDRMHRIYLIKDNFAEITNYINTLIERK